MKALLWRMAKYYGIKRPQHNNTAQNINYNLLLQRGRQDERRFPRRLLKRARLCGVFYQPIWPLAYYTHGRPLPGVTLQHLVCACCLDASAATQRPLQTLLMW